MLRAWCRRIIGQQLHLTNHHYARNPFDTSPVHTATIMFMCSVWVACIYVYPHNWYISPIFGGFGGFGLFAV